MSPPAMFKKCSKKVCRRPLGLCYTHRGKLNRQAVKITGAALKKSSTSKCRKIRASNNLTIQFEMYYFCRRRPARPPDAQEV
jgi:hypothetical protein